MPGGGAQSAWLHELLSPHVAELVVAVAPESKGAKDDLRDAWARAEELRRGSIRTRVYKAPLHLAALRNAVRGYGFAVRDMVRAMNRLRSVFLSRGGAVNDGIYNPKGRVKWLAKLTPPHRRLAEWLGGQLDQLVPLREQAEKWLLDGRWERSPVYQTRGLTRKRHPLLKSMFKGAASTVIAQLPEHPPVFEGPSRCS